MFIRSISENYNLPGMNSGKEILINAVNEQNAILKLFCH